MALTRQKKGLLKAPSSEDISSWPLMAAFYQVFAQWETLYAPLLGDPGETSALKKELSIVEPLNKVWNLIEECLRSLNLFNAALNASSSSYWETSGRSVRIRIESLLKRKSGVETGGSPLDTEGNIYESFNSIWNYVYAYATSYSISAAVPLNNSIPSPNEYELPPFIDLIHHMQEFLVYCSSFRPGGHPSADPLPKLYSTQPESRERMMNGLHQLRNLIAQLEVVCAKF
ncbi:Putative LOC100879143 [Caligus rogercresseyi]|uniref:LOC100879143 n=1 Tax=Caligus rogercresseyi TaxID=217165 RepID=A0A7T8JUE2_CALRO|nr:Putative LOC100879143 [Caligus rogercresseyi]